jgi:hypothetical protein
MGTCLGESEGLAAAPDAFWWCTLGGDRKIPQDASEQLQAPTTHSGIDPQTLM